MGFVLRNIKVKNTFIEDGLFDDDMLSLDGVDDIICLSSIRRQMSEPTPSVNLVKGMAVSPVMMNITVQNGGIFEAKSMDKDSSYLPFGSRQCDLEAEKEPHMGYAYDDDDEYGDQSWLLSEIERQETDHSWPVWNGGTGDNRQVNQNLWQSSYSSEDSEGRQVTDSLWPNWYAPTEHCQKDIEHAFHIPHGAFEPHTEGVHLQTPGYLTSYPTMPADAFFQVDQVTRSPTVSDGPSTMDEMPRMDDLHCTNSMNSLLPGPLPQRLPSSTQIQEPRAQIQPLGDRVCERLASSSWDNVQTVMLRNLPNKVTQQTLLWELEDSGFTQAYDFVYLPIDPDTNANKGYAFINFIDASYAAMFRSRFDGQRFANSNSDKVMSTWPAALQGFEANYAHYSNARVKHREAHARPLFLRDPQNGSMCVTPNRLVNAPFPQPPTRPQRQPTDNLQRPFHNNEPSSVCPANVRTRQGPATKICCECGQRVASGFKFCEFCGVPVTN